LSDDYLGVYVGFLGVVICILEKLYFSS